VVVIKKIKDMRATDVFNHKDGYRAGYAEFYTKIENMGRTATFYLYQLNKPEEHKLLEQDARKHYLTLLSCFIEDYYCFLEKDKELGIEPKAEAPLHLFTELSRMHFVASYTELHEQREHLLKHATDDKEIPITILTICPSLCAHEFWHDPLQNTPIMKFTQSQVIQFLIWLTTAITYMPIEEEAVEELRKLVQTLFTRNSVFLCQTCTADTLNVPEYRAEQSVKNQYSVNRAYIKFCSIYFNQLLRRLYYFDRLTGIVQPLPDDTHADVIAHWIKTTVCPVLGVEGFEDCYAHACEQVFTFAGDVEWFQYKYPERPSVHGPVLDCVRPALFRQYTGLSRVSLEPVLSAVYQSDIQGACSRRFILLAVDQYMRTCFGAHWYNATVVENTAIEKSQIQLIKTPCPCLIDILGHGYWVYTKNTRVYPTTHIYHSLSVWLQQLKEDYNCKLFHLSLSEIVDEVEHLIDSRDNSSAPAYQKLRKL
jgi:hypothetical protein